MSTGPSRVRRRVAPALFPTFLVSLVTSSTMLNAHFDRFLLPRSGARSLVMFASRTKYTQQEHSEMFVVPLSENGVSETRPFKHVVFAIFSCSPTFPLKWSKSASIRSAWCYEHEQNYSARRETSQHLMLTERHSLYAMTPPALLDRTQHPRGTGQHSPCILGRAAADISMEPVKLKVLIETVQFSFFQGRWCHDVKHFRPVRRRCGFESRLESWSFHHNKASS